MAPLILEYNHYSVAADIFRTVCFCPEFSTHQLPYCDRTNYRDDRLLIDTAIMVVVVSGTIHPTFSNMPGGSNNLLQERKRREVAERQVKETSANLHTLAVDLVPKVNALAHAVQVLEFENTQQLDLEAVSQDTFLSLQQQVEVLRQHQLDMQVKLHKAMDAKLERAQHEMRLDHEAVVMTVDNVKIEVDSMKEQLAIIRGEVRGMHDMGTQRSADRIQFEAISNRVREMAKAHQQKHELVLVELQEMHDKLAQVDLRFLATCQLHND
ncbi:hypothetical protein DYB34_006025 [Aphanomyces astaci]|uniref:Uncharacterized protein n=1 Tax=Aphanomyces astaci TaxID=112090 RepID=A0A3R6Z7B7_APHAT|nr:hypothetical protein DYB34_006025 [Aphanomyces astaci]